MQTRFERLIESVINKDKTQEEIAQELREIQTEVREIAKARITTLANPIDTE